MISTKNSLSTTSFLLVIALSFLLFSCESNTVQEDMKEYCSCIQQNKNNLEGRENCYALMEDIVKRYEFNPEAMREIVDEANNCY